MDPVLDSEWLGCKNDAVDETQSLGNIARSWQWRERGIDPPNSPSNKTLLENVAEDILVQKPLKIRCCELPGFPRSTFLMVFSPDGTKVASTHGNHNVYVSELASGKHVRILKGHPRTPWCIAFHPSHPQLIGSGCLGGQVRVWDISSGGSEVWNVSKETVIASIAFHPREQLLVIATYNELYFWDWSQPAPFTRVSTNNINEKVRYVAFDSLGYKLITGISLRPIPGGISNSVPQQHPTVTPANNTSAARRDDPDEGAGSNRPQDSSGSSQDVIVNSYQNLVQRYDSLVRNYQRLFMVRHRLTATPPPPSTTDRGTDPMETDPAPEANSYTRAARACPAAPQLGDENPTTGTSSNRQETDSGDGEGSSSRLLNLDALSFDSGPSRDPNSTRREHSIFGSRPSAFHPLNDTTGRSFRTFDENELASRLLPNPFSSTNGTPRPNRVSFTSLAGQRPADSAANSSRTSIFPAYRPDSPALLDLHWSRNIQRHSRIFVSIPNDNSSTTDNATPRTSRQNASATSTTNATQTASSTAPRSQSAPVDAQTINESLDLIRDILRDSGTRLLNLITNMSLSSLSAEEDIPRRSGAARAHSDDNESGERSRASTRPRVRLFGESLRPGIELSSTESDSDHSPEVNIFRTRNSTFREDDASDPERSGGAGPSNSSAGTNPTDRFVFELGEFRLHNLDRETGGINVSANGSRFRVRTQNDAEAQGPSTSAGDSRDVPGNSEHRNDRNDVNSNRPSTSRDSFWGPGRLPPEEALRKVRCGVIAMQKHTVLLTNMWLRGHRTTLPELRNMWENLRRRILTLHRDAGPYEFPTHYTRSILERCMMLAPGRNSRTQTGNQGESTRNSEATNTESVPSDEPEPGTSRDSPRRSSPSPQSRSSSVRSSPALRRRVQSSYRWRLEDEIRRRDDLRRRSRNPAPSRVPARAHRTRRDFARAMEISATRHEIRMRAMQILSIMFNMMMMCLEERGLSQLIINMLRFLKKALALTCLMLIATRNSGRGSNNTSPQRVDSLNVIRLENVDHTGPVNVDGPDEPPQSTVPGEVDDDRSRSSASKRIKRDNSTNSQAISTDNKQETPTSSPSTSTQNNTTQRWSNRLAVQISAANRNDSVTARNRQHLYIESRRLKALHKTNPTAHPLIKKRVLPPVSSHRIPNLRLLPKRGNARQSRAARTESHSSQPGPSGAQSGDSSNARPSRLSPDMINEFEHRINLIRLAHLQAVRLRNAARSRYRRLQTIRLYTPSSVREMFSLPRTENLSETSPENRSSSQDPDSANRRSFDYRPLFLTHEHLLPRGATNRPVDESNLDQLHNAIEDATAAAIPLLQMGQVSISNPDGQGNPPPRVQRIQEYLQPIILAQNAMVIDEDGGGEGGGGGPPGGGGGGAPGGGGSGGGASGPGGGMRRVGGVAGLLDASIISEALPAPSHRVQAWDFTTGNTPDIADSTKNVVVQRCRIHNDASIDISKDGRLLVALHPVPRLRNTNHWLGVYSLEWPRLGQCLHTAMLEQSAVSVALSPTARHLAVGLGSRRFTLPPDGRTNVFALLYRLDPSESTSRTGLSPVKELEQTWESGFTSLNCLRWAPQPGQGLVYANNTGQLIIMS